MSASTCVQTTRETGRFVGKNVLITGVSGGIGRATAERIVSEGGQVLITGTNSEKLDAVKAELPDVITLMNDAGDEASAERLGEIVKSEFGELDAAFLNAGYATFVPHSELTTKTTERDAISQVVQQYLDGAKSGSGEQMKPAFHEDATIFGYIGDDLFAGPIQQLFDWNDDNGPAMELQARIASIDLIDTVATVRLELDNWTGHRFTDLFTLLKVDGQWKIMNKVFHLHNDV